MVQLIGMLDSPYVRRVAVSLTMLDVPFEHRALSVFRDFEAFRAINPLVKAPTLVCDDGTVLMDSTLILDHVEGTMGRSLMPGPGPARTRALRLVGLALLASEKAVQIVYERRLRPEEKQHAPYLDRVRSQLLGGLDALEEAARDASPWLLGDAPAQPDISAAVGWRFMRDMIPDVVDVARFPALTALAARAEALPAFAAAPPD